MLALQQIKNIEQLKVDVPLYYIANYKGVACFSDKNIKELNIAVTFSLEMEATGSKKVEVQVNDDINYPLLPLIKMLKEEISRLDREGKLPW